MYPIDDDLITKIRIAQNLANKKKAAYAICWVDEWHVEKLDIAEAYGRDIVEIIRPVG